MATLQKFKLLATQCAVAGSPTRSPTASPVIHLRRRKTLRMLLNRTDRHHHRRRSHYHRESSTSDSDDGDDREEDVPVEKTRGRRRHKLKDLFGSSSPPPTDEGDDEGVGFSPETGSVGGIRGGGQSNVGLRPVTAAFRYRLLMRRAWRPMLVTIPE